MAQPLFPARLPARLPEIPGSPRVLLTGFGPFPRVPENATATLVPAIAERAAAELPHCHIVHDVLPVEWVRGRDAAARLIGEHEPDLILHFGVSDQAQGLVIETVARKRCQCAPDAMGELPPLELVELAATTPLPVSLPCDAILDELRALALPAVLSEDAGGYLCNAVLYNSLLEARAHQRIGFIHVPDGLADGSACLSMEQAIAGGVKIVSACLAN